eukprot:scaffold37103_cov45-Cyclotella_meneghiniana.AAC.3
MDLYPGSYGYAKIIDILSVVLSKPMTNNIDVDILSEAIPNLIEQLRVDINVGRRVTNIVIVMTAIAKASNDCRDRVLQTDVTNRLCGGLDDDDSIFSGHCLILLSLERRHERIMSSVDRIRSGYIRPLVNLMASDDQSELGREIRTAAYHFFSLLLKERMSNTTANAMVQANIIPTSIDILKQEGESDLEMRILHVTALSRIAELSSSHHTEMIDEGIMDMLPLGIGANSVELRSKWIALVNALITTDFHLDIIPTLIDSGVIRTLIESMKVEDTPFTQVLQTLKDAAINSAECQVLLLDAGVLKMTRSMLTQNSQKCHEWLSFLYSMIVEGKTVHDVLQKIVDEGAIVQFLVKTTEKCGIDFQASYLIASILQQKQGCAIGDAVKAGVIPILVNAILKQDESIMTSEHLRICAVNNTLLTLANIVETSDKHRDKVLHTELMSHAVAKLKGLFSRSHYYYLRLLFKMIHSGRYIEKVIDLELILLLVSWTVYADFRNSEDRKIPACALQILTDILRGTKYKKSIVEAVIDAGLVLHLATFIEHQVANGCNVRVAVGLLANLTKYHLSLCRDKVIDSILLKHLSSGIMSSCVQMQSCCVRLVHYIVKAGPGCQDVIKPLIDSGVIDALVDATENKCLNHIQQQAFGILGRANTQYSETKTDYIDLLNKKKSWLMVETCGQEVKELSKLSLKAALYEMKKTVDPK